MDDKNQSFQTGPTSVIQPQNRGTVQDVVPPPSPTVSSLSTAQPVTGEQNAEPIPSPYESLDGPDENAVTGSTAVVSTPAPDNAVNPLRQAPLPEKKKFGFRDTDTNKLLMRVIAGAMVVMLLIFGAGMISSRLSKNRAVDPVSQLEEQEVTSLNDGEASLAVKTSTNTLLVNGNILTTKSLQVTNGSVFGTIAFEGGAEDRTYTLPDASGTFCLDSNNCNYLQTEDITIVQTSLNNSVGDLTLQGTNNQVGVSKNGNVITLTAAQDIGTSSSPTFDSIILSSEGTQNGNTICDSSNNCGYAGGTDAFIHNGNSFSEDAVLGTNDTFALVFETDNTERMRITSDGDVEITNDLSVESQAVIGSDAVLTTDVVLNVAETFSGTAGAKAGISNTVTVDPTGASTAVVAAGANILQTVDGNANSNLVLVAGSNTARHYGDGDVVFMIGGANSAYYENTATSGSMNILAGAIDQAQNNSTRSVSLLVGNQVNAANSSSGTVSTLQGLSADAQNDSTGNITTLQGISANAQNESSGTVTTLQGVLSTATSEGSGNVTTLDGISSVARNEGSGTVTSQSGVRILTGITSTGNVTDNVGLHILQATDLGAGTITNNYGIQILNQTAGTNDYGIAIEGADTYALWMRSDTGDANDGIWFGDTFGVADTNLYRSAANTLQTNASFVFAGQALGPVRAAADPTFSFSASTNSGMYYDSGSFSPASVRIAVNGTSSLAVGSTGIWSVLDGTAAAPAWSFYSDRDTGLYLSAADTLSVTTGGTQRASINSNGLQVVADVDVGSQLAVGSGASITTNEVISIEETYTNTSGTFAAVNNDIFLNAAVNSSVSAGAGINALTVQGTGINYTGILGGGGNTVNFDSTGTASELMGAYGIVNNRGSGTVTSARGITGYLYNSAGGTITSGTGLYGIVANNSTGTIGTASGLRIGTATNPSGTITNNYGILVDPQTTGTNDYGVAIASADTQTLWLQGDGATAATGIGFGSARDVTLYRSAAGELTVDGDFVVTADLSVVNITVTGTLDVTLAATFNNTLTVNGHIITGNTSGSTTVSVNTGASGTGATASISGNDTSGVITINTGTGAAAGTLATVTFANAYGTAPQVVITPKAVPGGSTYPQYHFDSATTTFDLKSFNALTDSSTYTFSYFITQ